MSEDAKVYTGRVHTVNFQKDDFYILKVSLDNDTGGYRKTVSVKGVIPALTVNIGMWFAFEARESIHEKYGPQLDITRAPVSPPGGWSVDNARNMLVAQGVSSGTIDDMIYRLGNEKFLSVLESPSELASEGKLAPSLAEYIVERWVYSKTYFQTIGFLSEIGIPTNKIKLIWAKFDEPQTLLSKNPWALLEIDGFTFSDADTVAMRLNLPLGISPFRLRGAILHAIRNGRGFGHVFLTTQDVLDQVQELIPETTAPDMVGVIKTMKSEGVLAIDKSVDGFLAVYEPWFYHMETECTRLLKERMTGSFPSLASVEDMCRKDMEDTSTPTKDVISAYLRKTSTLPFSDDQLRGVVNALTEPVSIITGLPGSGKSYSLHAVGRVLQEAGIKPLLIAPTGIAAKRITASTGISAYTIHKAFGAQNMDVTEDRQATYKGIVGSAERSLKDGSGETWSCSPENPHQALVVVVDESSMADVHLLYRILTCTRPDARLVFVGDAAQLPSVGPGNVLSDMIESGVIPYVSLQEIFRQKDTSAIIYAAHDIYHGRVPHFETKSDFALIQIHSEDEVRESIVKLAESFYSKRLNFQVISPRHVGKVGVTTLNEHLRTAINPGNASLGEMRLGGETIREGDRIMVVRNDYSLGVYNGDVGKIARLDRKNGIVDVKIFGDPVMEVPIPISKASNILRLAYAVTCHKSQGSQWDYIILPLVDGFSRQLQRRLLYTAITRARKKVVILGTVTALAKAVANDQESGRNSLLRERLLRNTTP